MATNFPTSLDSLTNPTATDTLDSSTVPHADQHANANDAIEALQAKVGVNNSAVATSLDKRVSVLEASGGGVTDHGALTGLADDDHPQYAAIAQNETVSGTWTFSNPITIGSQLFRPVFVRKTANQSKTSDTTLANDADLKIALGTNQTWEVRGVLFVDSASDTPDVKFAFTIPAGASMRIGFQGLLTTAVATSTGDTKYNVRTDSTSASFGIGSNPTFVTFAGTVRTAGTAGDFQLQWAQNTSDAAATTLNEDSNIAATRVA